MRSEVRHSLCKHSQSLLNTRQSRWAKELLRNVRLSCCVAGVLNLVVKVRILTRHSRGSDHIAVQSKPPEQSDQISPRFLNVCTIAI